MCSKAPSVLLSQGGLSGGQHSPEHCKDRKSMCLLQHLWADFLDDLLGFLPIVRIHRFLALGIDSRPGRGKCAKDACRFIDLKVKTGRPECLGTKLSCCFVGVPTDGVERTPGACLHLVPASHDKAMASDERKGDQHRNSAHIQLKLIP